VAVHSVAVHSVAVHSVVVAVPAGRSGETRTAAPTRRGPPLVAEDP